MDLPTLLTVVKSASDVGSAVAHALKGAGIHPVLLELPQPGATRRLMSFADAVVQGQAELEGITAWRCSGWEEALAGRLLPGRIPLLVRENLDDLGGQRPAVLVDARMRKRQEPPVQLQQASLVLGIGPGFVAGVHAHAVIESNWGPDLGQVLWHGQAQAYTGQHRVVQGKGRERYLYAPHAGRFHTDCAILQSVQAGQVVGRVDDTPLVAEIGGVLRGLAYAGLQVGAGTKLVEIDPTGDAGIGRGIAERPRAIARGVLQAIALRWPEVTAKAGSAGARD